MNNLFIIREIAKRKNIKLRDLASKIGITEQGLQHIINNGTGKLSTIEKIAIELDIQVSELIDPSV